MQKTRSEPAIRSAYSDPAHRRLTCALLLAITVPVGLVWRFAPLHLPPFAFKYGGSVLWAAGVYWLIAVLLPERQPPFLAASAAAVSISVELFKLVRHPEIDRFRSTLPGKILIGRYFTFGALVAYLLAITMASSLDSRFRFGRPR